MPTTLGSARSASIAQERDATVVTRLKRAGAILLGKHNLTLLSAGDSLKFAYGRPRNPWSLDHDPGASSNGSAIAVAAGLAAAALGEDTGGSIRVPASHNGVVGLRPSWGRVSRSGLVPILWSADTVGPIAWTVRDAAMLLGVIAGFDPADPYTAQASVPDYPSLLDGNIGGLRVGVVAELLRDPEVDPQVAQRVEAAAALMATLGAAVDEASFPSAGFCRAISTVLNDSELAVRCSDFGGARHKDLDPVFRRRAAAGALIPSALYQKALRARALVRQQVLDLFQRFDILLSPCLPSPPPRLGQGTPAPPNTDQAFQSLFKGYPFTSVYSLAGVPALSVPCGFAQGNLPIGLQLAARPFDELTLFRAAHAYEVNSPWRLLRPNLHQITLDA